MIPLLTPVFSTLSHPFLALRQSEVLEGSRTPIPALACIQSRKKSQQEAGWTDKALDEGLKEVTFQIRSIFEVLYYSDIDNKIISLKEILYSIICNSQKAGLTLVHLQMNG